MNRYRLITLLGTALLLPASHAQPGYDVDIPIKQVVPKPSAPTSPSEAEKQAKKEAKAQAERDRLALKAAQDQNVKHQVENKRLKAALLAKPAPAPVPAPAATTTVKQVDTPAATVTAVLPPASTTASSKRQEAYPGGPVLITLPTGRLAMGETELSFAQWDACVNDTRSALRCKYKPKDKWGRGDQPVMEVSYDDIVNQYLPWLNDKTHAKPPYRLPTEAEWEYAARAGSKGEFSLGPNNSDKIDSTKSNYDANYSYEGSLIWTYREKTVPVNSFEPNAWGLFNMHGNVWEWTSSCKSEEEADCSRVLRGGSWNDNPVYPRSANRYNFTPGLRNGSIGFRVARTAP